MLRGTIIALFALGTLPALQAQGASEISGVVRDISQAPLANVRVTISNQATRSEVIVYSDDHGFYRAVNLTSGQYTLEATRATYQAAIRRDLNVPQGEAFRLDLELAPTAGGWSWPPQAP